MRDAFGGAFLIKIILIFLGIYIAFMAIALNYAKAFKVKNYIINMVEQYEGASEDAVLNIDNYINGIGYNPALRQGEIGNSCINNTYTTSTSAYCIQLLHSDDNRGDYYRVTTYMLFELPFFGLHLPVAISGETRLVTGNMAK